MKIVVKTILFLCAVALSTSCKQTGTTGENQKRIVHVAQATIENQDSQKEFSFIARPFRSSELSFRVGGPIDRFEVYAGNYYKRGDIIAEIDPRDFHIRKERAGAIYNQAKAEFERVKVLHEKNNISASTFEKAKADYTSAKMAFETATNELNDTKLVAPFNGYVGEVYIEKYQDVKPTQPVISFVDIDRLKIEAYVTQDIAFNSQNLKELGLRFDATPDESYKAQVVEISKSTTPNNLSYLLTALLPNKDGKLLSGMSGKLFVDVPSVSSVSRNVTIPQTALCHRPTEGDYVWVVEARTGKVAKRKIVRGKLLPGGKVTVVEGLQVNEIVAVSGLRFLSDGVEVEMSRENHVTSASR